MKIRMLVTKKGSPDGIHIFEYHAGQKYDVSPHLANIFLNAGWAEEDKVVEPETKMESEFTQTFEQAQIKKTKGKRKRK